jgi:hypothetical protein
MRTKNLTLLLTTLAAVSARAQQIPGIKVGDETIQIHAFASQGYADSN